MSYSVRQLNHDGLSLLQPFFGIFTLRSSMCPVLFLSVDPSLGKVDKASLSQLTLMELLVDGISNKPEICGKFETPHELEYWVKVTLNDSHEVTRISWEYMRLEGSINLQWIPLSVESFRVGENQLVGSIDLTSLPPKLHELEFTINLFEGEVSLEKLPEELEELFLDENKLFGSLNLESLPRKLVFAYFNANYFSGTVCLTKLPQTLRELDIGDNELSGCVDLTQLPPGIKWLSLCKNGFEGEADFSRLPPSLKNASFSDTQLSGTIVIVDRDHIDTDNTNVKKYF